MSQNPADGRAERRIGRGRIADQIVDDLRERILSGELPNGLRLPAERELAEQYGVSGSTVREAVRVLATVGLVSVRHGAGTFVTATSDTMIGMSIASVVRLEGAGAREVLGTLGALNRYAAQLAAEEASDAEIASLREAAEKLAVIGDTDRTLEDLRAFMRRLPEISHNALLTPVCRLLTDIQVEIAFALSGGKAAEWRRVIGGLHTDRLAIVEAVESRSAQRAADAVDAHSAHAAALILSSSQAQKIQLSDPGYTDLLAGVLSSRLSSSAN
jgi:GntR family transcriptional repressor for pyruvate dehydrogenase complex